MWPDAYKWPSTYSQTIFQVTDLQSVTVLCKKNFKSMGNTIPIEKLVRMWTSNSQMKFKQLVNIKCSLVSLIRLFIVMGAKSSLFLYCITLHWPGSISVGKLGFSHWRRGNRNFPAPQEKLEFHGGTCYIYISWSFKRQAFSIPFPWYYRTTLQVSILG